MIAELWTFRVEEGLGNACALIFPDGSGAVIDWGTNRDDPLEKLFALLQRRRSPRLRFVAATHPHADHTMGIERLLSVLQARGVQIDRLIYPTPIGSPREGPLRRARHKARELRIPMSAIAVCTLPVMPPAPVLALDADPDQPTDRWSLRAVAPTDTAIGSAEVQAERAAQSPGNETSLVLHFAFVRNGRVQDRGRAIIPGDATPATLNFAQRRSREFPDLSLVNDALVIPHHGSKHNWVKWLGKTIQGVALVSAPSGRSHHPSQSVLTQLVRTCGAGTQSRLYCTSFAGACFARFVEGANPRQKRDAPARMDPCFGDVGVRLSPDQPPVVFEHDFAGPSRRHFGHCGHQP